MILILKLDLDIVKMYHHTKNEDSKSRHSTVIAQTDRHTHTERQYENITFPHMWAVKIEKYTGNIREICQPVIVKILQISYSTLDKKKKTLKILENCKKYWKSRGILSV